MQQKDFGVIQKVCSLKTSNFQPAFPMFIPVNFTCRMLMIFWMKNWGAKREKKIFFCKLDIKDDKVFYTDEKYINKYTDKILKNACAFLIKLVAATKQLIRRNSICCLKHQAIFHRVNIEIGLTPSLSLFVFICSLRTPFLLYTKPFLKRSFWKRWKELMVMLVHSCI